ncbi:hypothetical protein Ga0466249_000117 [Sporomusaceae bacterium BoRhaA]|uniref:hypothetical protein n=1 Tax=Pelorhabdus rhamnosifermentans TaxID=2772457 RepID=UPI001C0647C5|nr:hypothetical protein [Pelorhabdus rhamnosifermentans]MBU2699038.1 hypothetical protein [Pelorhabdus rhamnosifermentans]
MTAKITKKQVQNDFNKLKGWAKEYFSKEDYSQSLCMIETASKLMYTFNLVYTDDDMEKMLTDIAFKVVNNKPQKIKKSKNKKIVFYDYFAIDNRGLTQQYINALIDLQYEILFITYDDPNKTKSERIFMQLNEYKKAKIHSIKNKNYIEAANELFNVVNEYGASTVLLHTAPWDVTGILTWSLFEEVEKYLINLTDHAFWLGKCCSDYILEFRSYGYNISRYYRNIPDNKLILLPYYPIQDNMITFEGFPFDAKGKKIIFSGGALYKVYGSNVFFNTIKYIVTKHKDTILLYAGSGNTKPFRDFIKINKLEDKVYLISERKDIAYIFKNCYFYLGTYPISGGLMTQYAVANKKIPLAYTDPILKCNLIESLFINTDNIQLTHTNLKDYYITIDKLLCDSDYKNTLEEKMDNLLITPKEFANSLSNCLQYKSTDFSFDKFDINIDVLSKLYFQMENNYLHEYYLMFIKSKNIRLLLHFKKNFIFGTWYLSKEKIRKMNLLFAKYFVRG